MTTSEIGFSPRRGCILQPKVMAQPLPWANSVTYPTTHNRVASKGGTDATVIVSRISAFGFLDQTSSAVFARCDLASGNARLFGRRCENVGMPAADRWRRRRSRSFALSNVPQHHASRPGEGTQTRFQHLDQTTRSRFFRIRVAKRIRRIFGQPVSVRPHHRLHRQSGTASSKANVSRRIPGVSPQTRFGMGRTIRLGLRPRPAYSPVLHQAVSHQAQDTTPLGLRRLTACCPGVAAKPQHRAEGSNPLGIPNHLRFALPQRGNVLQPRVAAQPLPWENVVIHPINPNGVVFGSAVHPTGDTTPLGLAFSYRTFPGVADKPQRRAEGSNPVGIPNRQRFALPQRSKVTQDNGVIHSALPQRGNVPQPRVAALPLPWVCGITHSTNPNGVVSRIASESIVKAEQPASIVRAEMEGGK